MRYAQRGALTSRIAVASLLVCLYLFACGVLPGLASPKDRTEDDEEYRRREGEVLRKGEEVLGDFFGAEGRMGKRIPAPQGACVSVRVYDNLGRPLDGRVTFRNAEGASRSVTTVARSENGLYVA